MKYSDMQTAIERNRESDAKACEARRAAILESADLPRCPEEGAKGKGSAVEPHADTNLEAEAWLGERIKQHGCDLYADGAVFTHFRDRVRKVITDNGLATVIVGRHEGRPENYAQTFERLYGEPLAKKPSTKATP